MTDKPFLVVSSVNGYWHDAMVQGEAVFDAIGGLYGLYYPGLARAVEARSRFLHGILRMWMVMFFATMAAALVLLLFEQPINDALGMLVFAAGFAILFFQTMVIRRTAYELSEYRVLRGSKYLVRLQRVAIHEMP